MSCYARCSTLLRKEVMMWSIQQSEFPNLTTLDREIGKAGKGYINSKHCKLIGCASCQLK